jgi:hypothetical protein
MVNGGIVCLCRKLVVPIMVQDRLVVLCRVVLGEMPSKIWVRGPLSIEVIGYSRWNFILIRAINSPASLLEGEIAIRNAELTCITCRASAGLRRPLRWLEI